MYDFESKLNRKKTGAAKWQTLNTKNESYPESIIPMNVADMEFKVMPEIKQALHRAVDEMDPYGYQAITASYLESVCAWMKRHHHVCVDADWIITGHSVVDTLIKAVKTFAKVGDGVLFFTPTYPQFYHAANNSLTHAVECPMHFDGKQYQVDFDLFEQLAKDEKNTILILCSPHNPIGKVYTKEELFKIITICKNNHILLIADEIHHDLIMEGIVYTSALEFLNIYEKIMVCTSVSKTFNLAGMQISTIIIENETLRLQMKEKRCYVHPLSMVAAQCAYNEGDIWIREMMHVIGVNYRLACQFFNQYFPKAFYSELQGTYLMWINMSAYFENEDVMFEFLYDKACFIVNRGSTFGENGRGFMRMNLALPTSELEKALKRLYQAYKNMKNSIE